jgi:hypothetical protein
VSTRTGEQVKEKIAPGADGLMPLLPAQLRSPVHLITCSNP